MESIYTRQYELIEEHLQIVNTAVTNDKGIARGSAAESAVVDMVTTEGFVDDEWSDHNDGEEDSA